jgi:hydroxymethylpyrimidine/phosphomethylpyrimidine kinase
VRKTLLSIAGFDPTGGAGALLDVKVFESLGFHGAAVLTAVTAQNTLKVKRVFPLAASLVELQYGALEKDLRFAGIKVGMLGSGAAVKAVSGILGKSRKIPRVVDPVLRSSSGAVLLERKAVSRFLEAFRDRASLITPNLDEASLFAERPVRSVEDMEEAARKIHDAVRAPCLVKGGHLRGGSVDVLFDGERLTRFPHARIGKDVHGTGCFLSSAILAGLARGDGLIEACSEGIALAARAIRKAGRVGRGRDVFR